MKIKNVDNGPRGINTEAGLMIIMPGETVEADVSEAELKIARESGWFDGLKAEKKG